MQIPVYVTNSCRSAHPDTLCLLPATLIEHWWSRCDPLKATYLPPGSVAFFDRDRWSSLSAGSVSFLAGRLRANTTEDFYFYFSEGRHRTRWLLDTGAENIPVGVDPRSRTVMDQCAIRYQVIAAGTTLNVPDLEDECLYPA